MPAVIKEDIIGGASARMTSRGLEAVRVFSVSNLSPGAGTLIQAIRELSTAGIYYNSAHPDEPAIHVKEIEPVPMANGNTAAKVVVRYGPPDRYDGGGGSGQAVYTFHGTTRSVTTNFDIDHKKIIVNYVPPGGKPGHVIGQVSDDKAFGVLQATFYSTDPAQYPPFLNALNSSTFRGFNKYCWWCRDVVLTPLGGRYRVELALELDEEGHLKTAVYRDPITDQIPEDIEQPVVRNVATLGGGWTTARTKKELDFNNLSLPQGFPVL